MRWGEDAVRGEKGLTVERGSQGAILRARPFFYLGVGAKEYTLKMENRIGIQADFAR